jgi:hypothetical protein
MITLPMTVSDEQAAIAAVAEQVARWLPRMRNSHENLASMLRDSLRRGDLIVTIKAVNAAERKDDWLADAVLRATYAEMQNLREPMSDQLRAFGERAVLRPPVQRGKGRNQYAYWSRNNGICFLVQWACNQFGVRPTRSRSARRDRLPSGISLVKQALEQHKIFLEERSIQDDIWFGLPGILARQAMAERRGEIFIPDQIPPFAPG